MPHNAGLHQPLVAGIDVEQPAEWRPGGRVEPSNTASN